MVLDRKVLKSRLLKKLLAHPELNHLKTLGDEELLTSIRETLQKRISSELWIFAYGSLIWNPLFPHIERYAVTVEGWQRQFLLVSTSR